VVEATERRLLEAAVFALPILKNADALKGPAPEIAAQPDQLAFVSPGGDEFPYA
jgi:hypothetical protein